MMRIEYRLDAEDYAAFSMFNLTHTRSGRRILAVQIALVAFILVGLPGVLMLATGFQPVVFGILVVFGAAWVALNKRILRFFTLLNLRRMLKDPRNVRFLAPQRMTIADGGLEVSSGFGESTIPYDSIAEIGETKDHLFVLLASQNGHAIPGRAFASPEARAAFVAELRRRVDDAKAVSVAAR
jgi:hypothetical protein